MSARRDAIEAAELEKRLAEAWLEAFAKDMLRTRFTGRSTVDRLFYACTAADQRITRIEEIGDDD